MKITARVKTKLKTVRKKAAKFWKDKKNRKIIFFVIGAVIIYIIVRQKRTTTTTPGTGTNTGNSGTKTGTDGTISPPDNTDPGSVNLKIITTGMDEHMRITRTTDGDLDYITDNTANGLLPNYERLYMVGAKVIRQDAPLSNYPVARNAGFRILKFNVKKGIQSMNQWPGQGEADNGYYQHDAGQSFDYNVTAAVQTAVYGGAQSGFENSIPANYDPTLEMPQWADIAPDLRLPKGHFFVLSRTDWTMDQVIKKGVTHIRHHEIPRPGGDESQAVQMKEAGLTYDDVPTSFTIFGNPLPNNPNDAQVDAMIARYSFLCDALKIGETMEQQHAIPPESPWLKRFYDGIRAIQKTKFIDKGIPALVCYNYFQFWPTTYHLGQVDASVSKENFRKPLEQLEHTNFSPGGSLSGTNLIMEAVYLGAPDIQQGQVFDLGYKLKLFKRMGYESGVFLAGEHEWRPNNMFLSQYPDGKYYSKGKIPLDPNTLITSTIFSQIYGKVFVQWGGVGKSNGGRIVNKFTFEPTYWKENGASVYKTSSVNPNYNNGANGDVFPYQSHPDFPHQIPGGVGYYGYNGNTDLCRFALQMYADTWGQIGDDGTLNFLSFRIDNGVWIEAVNRDADDMVNAHAEKRGLVDSIHKNGRIAWYFVNPFADNLWHDLDVRFPNGRVVRTRVAGNGTHIKLENM